MVSTVSANSVLSCTDVMIASAKACLPCAGVSINDDLDSLLHIDTSWYLGGGTLSLFSACVCVVSRTSSTSSVVTVYGNSSVHFDFFCCF